MSTSKQPIEYDSNPFTTGLTAVKKVFAVNPHTLIGVIIGVFAACAALGASVVAFWLATVVFITRHYADTEGLELPSRLQQMLFTNMPDGAIYALWAGSLVASVLLVAFIQALQLRFTVATARGVAVSFRHIARSSVGYILPLLGLAGLSVLAVVILLIIIGMLSVAAPIALFLLGAAAIVSVIYVSLRLTFAGYAIVDKNLGPIDAIKYSWRVTDGRLADILGVASLTSILFTVPGIIFGALAKVSEDVPGLVATFEILNLVLQIALVVVASMPLAERFVQSVAVYNKKAEPKPTSPFNFLAIALMLVLMPLYDALTMPTDGTFDPYNAPSASSIQESANDVPQGSDRAY